MPQLERMTERSADRTQSPYYVAWGDRPENKKRKANQDRRELRRSGASFLDILASYKPNPARMAWLNRHRKAAGVATVETDGDE